MKPFILCLFLCIVNCFGSGEKSKIIRTETERFIIEDYYVDVENHYDHYNWNHVARIITDKKTGCMMYDGQSKTLIPNTCKSEAKNK